MFLMIIHLVAILLIEVTDIHHELHFLKSGFIDFSCKHFSSSCGIVELLN